jgi:hypothetical protein
MKKILLALILIMALAIPAQADVDEILGSDSVDEFLGVALASD